MKYIISAVIFGHIDTDTSNAFLPNASQRKCIVKKTTDNEWKQQTEYNLLKYIAHQRNLFVRDFSHFCLLFWLFHLFHIIKYFFFAVQCCCCTYTFFFVRWKFMCRILGCPLLFFLSCTSLTFYLFCSAVCFFGLWKKNSYKSSSYRISHCRMCITE